MSKRAKYKFRQIKMLSSRVEQFDFDKAEQMLSKNHLTVQDFVNIVLVNYVSGTFDIIPSGSDYVMRF
jgi:hypothetical protein